MNQPRSLNRRRLMGALGVGLALGYVPFSAVQAALSAPAPVLPERVDLGVSLGQIGPALIELGAIDPERFVATYHRAGHPLGHHQQRVLLEGTEQTLVFDHANAYFLLNLLWALGLANANPILTRGPMMQGGLTGVGRFASTGGWILGQESAMALYSSAALIRLNPSQQARVEEVAAGVYRPCCGNSTDFPDCNHGMAMLGLLQLLAANDFSTDQLFDAAKAANRFWYPEQTAQVGLYLEVREGTRYADADSRQVVGRELFSGAGFKRVSAWLKQQELQAPRQRAQSCSV